MGIVLFLGALYHRYPILAFLSSGVNYPNIFTHKSPISFYLTSDSLKMSSLAFLIPPITLVNFSDRLTLLTFHVPNLIRFSTFSSLKGFRLLMIEETLGLLPLPNATLSNDGLNRSLR